MKKRRSGLFSALSWPALIGYGLILALGVLALEWIEMHSLRGSRNGELRITILAAIFLGVGLWAGAQLFRNPSPSKQDAEGNRKARETLGISDREFEVLELLAEGHSNKEIARLLNVSPNTIKTHVARLLEKLEANRRTQAIQRARELGLVR